MRNGLAIGFVTLAIIGAVAGCTPQQTPQQQTPASTTPTTATGPPPPEEKPAKVADCPYLPTDAVEQRNGQKVSEVKISRTPPGGAPSCFFYRSSGERQLRTRVFSGNLDTARAVVDQAAPIKTSARASLPGGWEGGEQPAGSGSVYAVAKPDGNGQGTAVVVFSNQAQSVKGRELAKFVIHKLHL
jgi:UPF0176 protein